MRRPHAVLALTVCAITFLTSRSTAQSADPHLPEPRALPGLNEFVQVDDMLLWPDQFADLTAPPVSRRQANDIFYGMRQFQWEWGVVPYEIAPNFSEAERQRIFQAMTTWQRTAPIVFVPRTTQTGFVAITRDELAGPEASPCFAATVGHRLGFMQRLNLGSGCSANFGIVLHEMGHVLGFQHEHQRFDRDDYITVDIGNIVPNARYAFDKWPRAAPGPYDFESIMHYPAVSFALDVSRPTIIPKPQYQSAAARMGQRVNLSETDHNMMAVLYFSQMTDSAIRTPTEPLRRRFDRGDMLLAMERLHGFYMSKMGLQRPQGLSIDGRPDFLGIAQWIFDIYLPARSAGFSTQGAFDIVVATITRTDEWRQKNPGRSQLTPASFRPAVSFNREEFLDVLNKLDRFYSAPEGLQRPNGLSISGGPDFLGIATWIFDIYLAERLNGISANAAWTITENAIRATNEWRSKH